MREGNDKLDQGQYLDALDRFQRARELFPSAKLLFNIAQTLNELGRSLEALEHYERFVREATPEESPELWRTAHERIFRLQGAIARVELQTNVPEVQVTIDGKPVGATPLAAPVRLLPGAHAIVLARPGYERQVIELTLGPGDLVSRRVAMPTEEEGAATRRAVQQAEAERRAVEARLRLADEEAQRRRARTRWILRTTGWVAVGAGLATVAAGVVLGGMSLGEQSAAQGTPPGTMWRDVSDGYDRAASYGVASLATLSAGAALAVAGGVLTALGRAGRHGERRISIAPTLGAGLAGAGLAGAF
jgi:hypothetical protein